MRETPILTTRPSSTATTGASLRPSSSESWEGGDGASSARSARAALAAGEGAGVEPGSTSALELDFAGRAEAMPAVVLAATLGGGATTAEGVSRPWGIVASGLSWAPATGRRPSVSPVRVAITTG